MSCIYWEHCIVKSRMQSSAESENQSEMMEYIKKNLKKLQNDSTFYSLAGEFEISPWWLTSTAEQNVNERNEMVYCQRDVAALAIT